MPVSFCFKDNSNPDRIIKLAEIDEECCAFAGVEVQEKYNCRTYDDLIDCGFSICANQTQATIENFNLFEKRVRESLGDKIDATWEKILAFYKKMLIEKYTFHAWR